jgi:hypothetical protein
MLLNARAAVLAAAVLQGTATLLPQTPAPEHGRILLLAREGRHQDAWKAWEALAPSPEQLRLGITLAVATGQLARGVDLYATLETGTHKPDRRALTDLALRAAEELSTSADVEARVSACGAALLLDKSHAACRRALDAMAKGGDADEQALAVYTLANAGVPPPADRLAALAKTMSRPRRLQLARRMTRLSGAERLALVQPLLNDRDLATRYETVLVATEIPGPEVAAALGAIQTTSFSGGLETAIMLARARHGDTSKLNVIARSLPTYTGFNKVTAARILAAAKDKRGLEALKGMLKSPEDTDRLLAAEAMAEISPESARPVLTESLRSGGAAIRQSAMVAAGRLELGTAPEIYRKLTDTAPPIRAAAVEAISTTFVSQDNRARPPRLR